MAGRMVQFPSNGGTASGYLATPASGKGPGVLVIQEWWGLVSHIKNVCDRFAAEGFSALAPDLYHGQTASEPDGAGKLFAATLNPSVGATVNFYGIHPNVKPDYAKLSGPVLGLFAEQDSFVTPQTAKDTDAAIKKAGKQSEIHIYPN